MRDFICNFVKKYRYFFQDYHLRAQYKFSLNPFGNNTFQKIVSYHPSFNVSGNKGDLVGLLLYVLTTSTLTVFSLL